MRGLERPPWWAVVLTAVGVVWLAVGGYLVMHRSSPPAYAGTPLPAPTSAAPTSAAPPSPAGKVVLSDDFARPDSATVGTAPTGQRWNESGAGGCAIQSHAVTAEIPQGGNCYLSAKLDGNPTALQVKAHFTGGGALTGGITMIASTDAGWSLQDMVHFQLDPSGWVLQLRTAGGTFDAVADGGLQLKTDGTVYSWGMLLSGDTATLELPDGTTRTVTNPRIGQLTGPYVTFEPGSYPNADQSWLDSAQAYSG